MDMKTRKGFTMVELLVVLVIIGILAGVAAPLYLQHTKRAKISEAISTMSLIRQAERDYKVNHSTFFDVAELVGAATNASGNIQKGLPSNVAAGTEIPSPNPSGVDINVGVSQYFANPAFYVEADTTQATVTGFSRSKLFTNPDPVDFIIRVEGSISEACVGSTDTNCAIHNGDVAGYEIEMDNSGRIFVCYGACTTAANWIAY